MHKNYFFIGDNTMADTLLPENDSNTTARQENLRKNQKKYRYKYDYQSLKGVPMADGVPCKELPRFPWIKQAIIAVLKMLRNVGTYQMLQRTSFRLSKKQELSLLAQQPRQMSDYIRYFQSLDIPKITFSYQDDSVFARMRVAGQNPVMLTAMHSMDPNFKLSDQQFQSIEGFSTDSLTQAMEDGRLFIVDYKKLENIQNGDNGHGIQQYNYAPKAIFAIPNNDVCLKQSLIPIAIQCGQITSTEMPIYIPLDGVAWEMAKTIVQIADFNYHELISHLAATHLLIEPFVVTSHRQLADNHPLKILLLPHFEGTLFINWAAQLSLVNDGGKVDTLFSGTIESSRKLVGERLILSFNQAMLPNQIQLRGVENSNLIYPYRDDALSLWEAISKWVGTYLDVYYKKDQDIINDVELSAWVTELIEAGHVVGFGDNESGKITSLAYLKQAVTMLIFTSSAQHAAVNFTQHDFAGYPPNMPAAGYTPPPTTKQKNTEEWLDLLPPVNMSAQQVELVFLLSAVYYTTLGQYKEDYFSDPAIAPLLESFTTELAEIETIITARNKKTDEEGMMPYTYLLPSKIPQSINI